MKRLLLALGLGLLFLPMAMAQLPMGDHSAVVGLTLTQGFTVLQDTLPIDSNFNSKCAAGTSCTITVLPTTANSGIVAYITTTNNVTISSVSGGSGTYTHTSCHIANTGHDNMDASYSTNVTGGTTSFTVTLSGASGTNFYFGIYEIAPPPGYSIQYDTCANMAADSTTCSGTCSGVSFTGGTALTATDGVVIAVDSGGTASNGTLASPYQMHMVGDFYGMNVPAGSSTPTTNQTAGASGFWTQIGVAWKSTANNFNIAADTFSVLNCGAVQLQVGSCFTFGAVTCNPSCDLTLTSTTGSSHALVLFYTNSSGSGNTLSSLGWTGTNGGTWTIPGGCATTDVSIGTIGCAYILSSTSGATKIHATMANTSSTYNFAFYETSRTSGSFVLDAVGATDLASSSTPAAQALTLSGSNDACFQAIIANTSVNYLGDLYYFPGPGGDALMGPNSVASVTGYLLNTGKTTFTGSNSGFKWLLNSSAPSLVSGICLK